MTDNRARTIVTVAALTLWTICFGGLYQRHQQPRRQIPMFCHTIPPDLECHWEPPTARELDDWLDMEAMGPPSY
jgi:hypothetical protein